MASIEYEIESLFNKLPYGDQQALLAHLAEIAKPDNTAEKTYLEDIWEQIQRLMADLDLETFIDDQYEVSQIWKICEDVLADRFKLDMQPWEDRFALIRKIVDGAFFDQYAVMDPMMDLMDALIQNQTEKKLVANYMLQSSPYMQSYGAKLYKDTDEAEVYYHHLETRLGKELDPYMELIQYYQIRDPEKAIALAELARDKCRPYRKITPIYLYLLDEYEKRGDVANLTKLIESAKRRSGVNFAEIEAHIDVAKYQKKKRNR